MANQASRALISPKLKSWWQKHKFRIVKTVRISAVVGGVLLALSIVSALAYWGWLTQTQLQQTQQERETLAARSVSLQTELANTLTAYEELAQDDQVVRNNELQAEIESIQETYTDAIEAYESILDLRGDGGRVQTAETLFAQSLNFLADRNFASASATITTVRSEIATQRQTLAVAAVPANLPTSNTPPAAGSSSRQVVDTEIGQYAVDLVAADLNSTRVVVETASEQTCTDNCPVNSLAAFVSSAGGFAGINGPYFCPAEYPSCAGKTNSFDTLLMNRQKTYFNSDNNVYSSVPALIFSGSSARLVGQSQEWGRDTGVDAVIASQPMLLSGGNITFGGDGDPKKGSRGNRSFIGSKDSTVYIGVVRNATVAEVAYVLKALGLQSALNLDSGGSTALYSGGRYLAGPGRNTPFGIVLVRK